VQNRELTANSEERAAVWKIAFADSLSLLTDQPISSKPDSTNHSAPVNFFFRCTADRSKHSHLFHSSITKVVVRSTAAYLCSANEFSRIRSERILGATQGEVFLQLISGRRVFVTFLIFATLLIAQEKPKVRRDAGAIAFLTASVIPLSDAITQETTVIVGGSAKTPDGKSFTFHWTTKGGQFRYENTDGSTTSVLLSNNGAPRRRFGKARSEQLGAHIGMAMAPLHLPFYLISNRLANADFAFEDRGTQTLKDTSVRVIRCYDDRNDLTRTVTQQDWYLDASSGMPVQVEYRSPDARDPRYYSIERVEFTKYSLSNGITVPVAWSNYSDGELVSTMQLNSIDITTNAASSLFEDGDAQ
jgi:hypothetical protein